MKKKTPKPPNPTKSPAKTAVGKVGYALASTASFAAGVVRETESRIRDLASSVTKSTELGPSPGATYLLVHQHRLVEGLFERLESSKKGFDGTLREGSPTIHAAHISIEEHLFYPAVRKVNPNDFFSKASRSTPWDASRCADFWARERATSSSRRGLKPSKSL